MTAASGHLLRTLAAVSPQSRVVVVGSGDGVHTEALARLGFEVWACAADPEDVAATRVRLGDVLGAEEAQRRAVRSRPDALGYPDGFADWLVLDVAPDAFGAVLPEAARVLAPGAWLWTETADPDALLTAAEAVGLALAEAPASEPGRAGQHVIVRRPDGVG